MRTPFLKILKNRLRFGSCCWAALALAVTISGCGSSASSGRDPRTSQRPLKPGSVVTGLEFVRAFENEPGSPYYPIGSLAGCEYTPDGTLIVCDDQRGLVLAFDPRRQTWFELDTPLTRPYQPVDVRIDGFKVLILDAAGSRIFRFDMNGAYLDMLLDVKAVDPVSLSRAVSFAVDRDGRIAICDPGPQQVLLLDAFLNVNMRMGEPGSDVDQFDSPVGITFLPDGSLCVSDQGNRRLALYGRMGFFEANLGGDLDPRNPLAVPAGVGADKYGNIFVADNGNGKIHVWNARQQLVLSAGEAMPLPGIPLGPVDVAIGPAGELAVTDRARSAVLIYRILYE